MDLEAKPLQYFAAVARESSFSRAAARLHVSQPSLSAQVRELERRLGFALFTRTSRKVELTREGRFFLPQALQVIAEAARMNRAVRDIRENELSIGAAIYTVLIPERVRLIDDFVREHPSIAVLVTNFDQTQTFSELRRGSIDLGVVIGLAASASDDPGPVEAPASEIVLPRDVERARILAKRIELLIPRESPLAELDPVPLAALSGVRVATLGGYHGAQLIDAINDPLEAVGADLIVPPEGNAIAVERFGQSHRMPAVSIGWFHYADQPESQDMVRRPVEGLDVSLDLAVIRPLSAIPRPAAQAFWSWAVERSLDAP